MNNLEWEEITHKGCIVFVGLLLLIAVIGFIIDIYRFVRLSNVSSEEGCKAYEMTPTRYLPAKCIKYFNEMEKQ